MFSNVFVSHNKRDFLTDAFILENLLCRWKRLNKTFVKAWCWKKKKSKLLLDYFKMHCYCFVSSRTKTKIDISNQFNVPVWILF